MSSLAEDNQRKLDELTTRIEAVEKRTFPITKRDVTIVVICALVISVAITMCLIGQMYMIYQSDRLYSLLKSI